MLLKSSRVLAALSLLLPVAAYAHPADAGHMNTVLQGVLHPLTGLDHLVFMLALGVHAAHLPRKLCIGMGLASMLAIVLGAAPQSIGLASEVIEVVVLASLALAGVALIASRNVPALLALPFATVLSFFHGLAHAETGIDGLSRMEFITGLVLTSAALFGIAGLVFGFAAARNPALQDRSCT
jgi:urease accessory protein